MLNRRGFLVALGMAGVGLNPTLTGPTALEAVETSRPNTAARLRLLFQRTEFTKPIDSFFEGTFEPLDGRLGAIRDISTDAALHLALTIPFDGSSHVGFVPPQDGKRYRLFYERVEAALASYRTVFIDTVAQRSLLAFDASVQAQLAGADALYVDGLRVKRRSLETGRETELEHTGGPVWTIAVVGETLWKFHVAGRAQITRVVGGREQAVGSALGLVTNTGMVTKDWLWFSKSTSEKDATGDLWMMRVASGRKVKAGPGLGRCRLVGVY